MSTHSFIQRLRLCVVAIKLNDMTELEKHREIWQGKSDEWLFERLALELKDKVETIHQLLAENEQLSIANVVGQSEQLKPNGSYYTECECGNMVHARENNCKKCGL